MISCFCSYFASLQDISREFPRALDVGAHAGHIYRAICEKVPRVGRYAVRGPGSHRAAKAHSGLVAVNSGSYTYICYIMSKECDACYDRPSPFLVPVALLTGASIGNVLANIPTISQLFSLSLSLFLSLSRPFWCGIRRAINVCTHAPPLNNVHT